MSIATRQLCTVERLGALMIIVAFTCGGEALAEQRFAEVYTQRVQLQKEMKESLEQTLRRISHPYDIMVTVEVRMQGMVTESTTTESQPGLEMKMESKKSIKLPGLPQTDLPNSKTDSPNISFKVPSHEKVQVNRKLNAMVSSIRVRLYVEEGIPDERLEQVKVAATQVGGLDEGRGDTLDVQFMSPLTAQRDATVHPVMLAQRSVWIACLTFLMAMSILAWGISRRRSGAAQMTGQLNADVQGGGAGGAGGKAGLGIDGDEDDDLLPAITGGNGSVATLSAAQQAGGIRAFTFLSTIDDTELIETLSMLSPPIIATVLDQLSISGAAIKRLFDTLPEKKHLQVILALGHARVIPMTEIHAMEKEATSALETVRSRMSVGSTTRVVDILGEAPEATLQQILGQLAADDPELGEKVRKGMILFEDLDGLDRLLIKQIVANTDPTTMAKALHGSEEDTKVKVKAAISKRLLRILDAEEEALGEVSEDDVAGARRAVETTMRRVARAARQHNQST